MKLDLVISGVAGQGVMTMARVLANAATRENFDAHHLAFSGISQLEGSVTAHVRIGIPAAPSPKVPLHGADFVVSLDRLEAIRVHRHLAPGGKLLISRSVVLPLEARTGAKPYPTEREVEDIYSPHEVLWVPLSRAMGENFHAPLPGAVMLGALAAASPIVDRDQLVRALQEEVASFAEVETEAFFDGYNFISGGEA